MKLIFYCTLLTILFSNTIAEREDDCKIFLQTLKVQSQGSELLAKTFDLGTKNFISAPRFRYSPGKISLMLPSVIPDSNKYFELTDIDGLKVHSFPFTSLTDCKYTLNSDLNSDCINFGVSPLAKENKRLDVSICYNKLDGKKHDLTLILEGVMLLLTQRCSSPPASVNNNSTGLASPLSAKNSPSKPTHRFKHLRKQKQ